ncbi:N-acetylneuraminate synthase family protein [Paenibacillus sp. 1P07SE]|uniref:N-acetylneuraminate synthase family protein n=1 Tax=Paenibacillus sp. 1P07SE TaxID=3132209 RepID=UPI0039A59E5E
MKLQLFHTSLLVCDDAPLAEYQRRTADAGHTQRELLQALELPEETILELRDDCVARGIDLLATPFDSPSLHFLARQLAAPAIKIGSGDLTHLPLLLEAARYRRCLLLSTGMSTLAEVEQALAVLAYGLLAGETDEAALPDPPSPAAFRHAYVSPAGQAALQRHVILLHATSEYPAPPASCNLRSIDTLSSAFGLAAGLSDHSEGSAIAIAAAARGACVIEKHLTLDRMLPGVDQQASLEPAAFAEMVRGIRQVEQALGSGAKLPATPELQTAALVRRSLVAAAPIAAGEPFTERNLAIKRPGTGMSPARYWELLGSCADRDYRKDEQIR